MTEPARPSREARIDLSALRSNVVSIRAAMAPAQTMVVVKAQAYGHGAVPVAQAAVQAGAEWLGVIDIREALELRSAGITAPVLTWLHGPDADFASAIEADLDLGLSSLDQLERAAAAGRATVQLKLDTGLGRNGIVAEEAPAVFDRAAELERAGAIRVRGLFSHLSNTSVDEDSRQLARFEKLVAAARAAGLDPEIRHLAASAAAITAPAMRLDLVRIGIAAYGIAPDPGVDVSELALRPVMELSAEVISVKRVPQGSGVSYGFTYRAPRPTTLALIPMGYADGIPRAASNRGPVAIRGGLYRIAGRVAMDQFVVDVGDDEVAVGDRAVLWGDPATGAPSVDEWAEAADTISYELVARIGGRIERTTR